MKVYLVRAVYDFEGHDDVCIMPTIEDADRFIKDQQKLIDEYQVDLARTGYASSLQSPLCNPGRFEILEFEVGNFDHYEYVFKNLSLGRA